MNLSNIYFRFYLLGKYFHPLIDESLQEGLGENRSFFLAPPSLSCQTARCTSDDGAVTQKQSSLLERADDNITPIEIRLFLLVSCTGFILPHSYNGKL